MRSTNLSKRPLGPKMQYALSLLERYGSMARIDLAARVGPHGSLSYGYAIINRLIRRRVVATGYVEGRRGLMLVAL